MCSAVSAEPIHAAKCTGASEAVPVFRALGTAAGLATQLWSVPTETVGGIIAAAAALVTGPPMAPVPRGGAAGGPP